MCGRFTNKLTWDDIVRLYRLTLNAPPPDTTGSTPRPDTSNPK